MRLYKCFTRLTLPDAYLVAVPVRFTHQADRGHPQPNQRKAATVQLLVRSIFAHTDMYVFAVLLFLSILRFFASGQ